MILQPAILALLAMSLATSGLLVHASYWAAVILREWDPRSGKRRQLELERRTYLVSTTVAYAMVFELSSVFLYVLTADRMAPLFAGAMCAAGTLHVNGFGYPALAAKLVASVVAGAWLVLNHADDQGWDYPLIRRKYALLLVLTPIVLAEGALQAVYFLRLRPDVITSCCGSLFGTGSGVGSDLAGLPGAAMGSAFFSVLAVGFVAGAAFLVRGRGAWVLAVSAVVALPVGIAAMVSYVSPYVYELPTHHCPFCLLQPEYGYIGYAWYGALLLAAVCGGGVGVLAPHVQIESLAAAVPRIQRRLAALAIGLLAGVALTTAWRIAASQLRM